MKTCPVCNQTYEDSSLNYCLNDGSALTAKSDSPPTVVMDSSRETNPNYSNYGSGFGDPNKQMYQPPPASPSVFAKQDQTLPVISLILGVFGIVLICCYGGFPLGAAAMITGYIGLNNVNKDPVKYTGRGLALGGIITGAIGFLITIGMFIIVLISGSL